MKKSGWKTLRSWRNRSRSVTDLNQDLMVLRLFDRPVEAEIFSVLSPRVVFGGFNGFIYRNGNSLCFCERLLGTKRPKIRFKTVLAFPWVYGPFRSEWVSSQDPELKMFWLKDSDRENKQPKVLFSEHHSLFKYCFSLVIISLFVFELISG